MKVILVVLVLVPLIQLPETNGKRLPHLPTQLTVAVRDNGKIWRRCTKEKRIRTSMLYIKFKNGKKWSIYQPSMKQRTFHPRFYTIPNITRFSDCAKYADKKEALMFEIHDGSRCKVSFFQYRRYKQKQFCKRDFVRHLYMLEDAKRRGKVKEGVCILHDQSLLRRHHTVTYASVCNKLRYDCMTKTGRPTTVGTVFEKVSFGCIYRQHRAAGDYAFSRKFCKRIHSTLFIPKTIAERKTFLSYHKRHNVQTTYVGIRRRYRSKRWRWLGGGKNYYNDTQDWAKGYPDPNPKLSCMIVERRQGKFRNVACDRKLRSVCYKRHQPVKIYVH